MSILDHYVSAIPESYMVLQAIAVGSEVLKKNKKRSDRKGGNEEDAWQGPYVVVAGPTKTGLYQLKNEAGHTLKRKESCVNLKIYKRHEDNMQVDEEEQEEEDEERDQDEDPRCHRPAAWDSTSSQEW